jgi:hypothetical protein
MNEVYKTSCLGVAHIPPEKVGDYFSAEFAVKPSVLGPLFETHTWSIKKGINF